MARRLLRIVLLCGLCSAMWAATTSKPLPVKGFILAEPFGPPNEDQTRSLIEGGKAVVYPSGSAQISDGVTVHTFNLSNAPQLTVRARECFYDATNHTVNSAGPIQMQTADGKFTIEGTGFFWQETNSSLVISNQVHTVIQSAVLQPGGANLVTNGSTAKSSPLFIDSVRFNYDGPSGAGTWRDKVVVTGSNLVVRSEVLTAEVNEQEVSKRQVRQVESFLAEKDVSLDYGEIHSTGGRMTYAPDTGVMRISDHATWQAGPTNSAHREGGGDELVIDRTNQIFQANHHSWLRLPGQTLGDSGFLSGPAASGKKKSASDKASVLITSESYEIRTNWASFRNQARLEQRDADTVRGWLTSDQLTATFLGSNNLQTLTADKNVIMQDSKERLTGGHALYTHTNGLLEMTQNPTWQMKDQTGGGELIRIDTQRNEMFVHGNASMNLPANQLASQLAPAALTNNAPRTTRALTNQFAHIYCEEYTLATNRSTFRGGVYATHPEMNWSCERLTVETPAAGLTNLVAEQEVVFDLLTQKGEIHGKGDKSVYTFGAFNTGTNGIMLINELRLTGLPAIISGTNGTFTNPLIIWDRLHEKLTLPGNDYKIQGFATVDTNRFVLPNKKRTK